MQITFINILDTEYIYSMRDWRNQDFVRKNMINQDYITEDDHLKYIQMLKAEKDTRKVFIAFSDNTPFAIVNFIIYPNESIVEPGMYIIDHNYLGKGFGQILSFARLEYIFRIMPEAEVRTTILKTNETNLALQAKFGFKEHHTTLVRDGNGIEREAQVLYLTKTMWQDSRNVILQKLYCRFASLEICDIPNG